MENGINEVSLLPLEERNIKFFVLYEKQLILSIINPYIGDIVFDKQGLPLQKEDGHGTGPLSVKDFINTNKGEVIIDAKCNLFKVLIWLPCNEGNN